MKKKIFDRAEKALWRSISGLMTVLILCGAVSLGGGCTRKVYVPVERMEVRVDSIFRVVHSRDSVYVADSVWIDSRGDSVIIRQSSLRYRDRFIHDTIRSLERDTIRIPMIAEGSQKEKQAEKSSALWKYGCYGLGILFVVMMLKRVWGKYSKGD